MGRPSNKAIITKLRSIRSSAIQLKQFNVAAKFELRIIEFENKRKNAKKTNK